MRTPMQEVKYCTVDVDGIKVFYREAGPADGAPILLLQGCARRISIPTWQLLLKMRYMFRF
jgi:hypothetical protein